MHFYSLFNKKNTHFLAITTFFVYLCQKKENLLMYFLHIFDLCYNVNILNFFISHFNIGRLTKEYKQSLSLVKVRYPFGEGKRKIEHILKCKDILTYQLQDSVISILENTANCIG